MLEEGILPPPMEREDKRDSHDPDKPGEDKVSHSEAIPYAVVKEPVPTSSIVDKDHDGKRHPVLKGRKILSQRHTLRPQGVGPHH